MQEVIRMSAKERDRAHAIRLVVERKLRQREAAEQLGVGKRQVIRLVKLWRAQGDAGLVSRQRGRLSPRRIQAAKRAKIEVLEPLAKLSGMKEFLGVAAGFMGWVLAGDGWMNGLRHFSL